MTRRKQELSMSARQAVQARDWHSVGRLARDLVKLDSRDPEGHFLLGLAGKAANNGAAAQTSFARALKLDEKRYDAAVELAAQLAREHRNGEAFDILRRYEATIGESPLYLDLAASVYMRIGKWNEAWSLLQRADSLQPGVERIVARIANCAVSLGKIDEAKQRYAQLLERNPAHQQNHYQLARLERATDASHVDVMKSVLSSSGKPPAGNIFLYYALGKELEDLERWDEAFAFYQQGGDAAAAQSAANYRVEQDIELIDSIIETCTHDWFSKQTNEQPADKLPLFVVGLPRTGTTLVERILSSHSMVESAGETLTIEHLLRGRSGWVGEISPQHIRSAAGSDLQKLAKDYIAATEYLLEGAPWFIEKYTYNFLHLGLIAAAFPASPIVHLRRHPMDASFAMYKQPYFRFAYTLDDVGRFYVAYRRLMDHWRELLGERLVEIDYEALVGDQEQETRRLLDKLGLAFERGTLEFDRNVTPSATASAVQVREKVHSRSVGRWREFERQLEPLRQFLVDNDIDI